MVAVFFHVVGPIEHFLDLIDAALAICCNVGRSFGECNPNCCQFSSVDSPFTVPGGVDGNGHFCFIGWGGSGWEIDCSSYSGAGFG